MKIYELVEGSYSYIEGTVYNSENLYTKEDIIFWAKDVYYMIYEEDEDESLAYEEPETLGQALEVLIAANEYLEEVKPIE